MYSYEPPVTDATKPNKQIYQSVRLQNVSVRTTTSFFANNTYKIIPLPTMQSHGIKFIPIVSLYPSRYAINLQSWVQVNDIFVNSS
jgi:hypothetical protein